MKDYKSMTVAEIVTEKIEAGDVFKKIQHRFLLWRKCTSFGGL